MSRSIFKFQFISIMICFFVMGSIEMVGIASNYIKITLHLSDTKANFLPFLVYIWFFICTIPTGLIMDKIGRKRTLQLSMLLMCISNIIALLGTSYSYMVSSFILLGVSNVCMQSSLYPLVQGIIKQENLPRTLTIGQFVKTLSSFSAPYVTMLGSLFLIHFFNFGWRFVFLFYLVITIAAMFMLYLSGISNLRDSENDFTFKQCLSLLKNRFIFIAFIGVMCHVGIDISTNTVAPKIIMERLGVNLDSASFGSSLYFIARLIGCFIWAFLLKYISNKKFFYISVGIIFISIGGLFFAFDKWLIYLCIALIGIGNSNIFPVIFSFAGKDNVGNKSMISELMIMGQAGGALFPLLMGVFYDLWGLDGSLLVLFMGVIYLSFFAFKIKE